MQQRLLPSRIGLSQNGPQNLNDLAILHRNSPRAICSNHAGLPPERAEGSRTPTLACNRGISRFRQPHSSEDELRQILHALATLSCFAALTACVQNSTAQSAGSSGWRTDCTSDAVTNDRRCFAGTFGVLMGSDGSPILAAGNPISAGPLQVYFLNGHGPYILAGLNTFPGRQPSIRFDHDLAAFTVSDDAGVSIHRPDPRIVDRMLHASVARVRYHVWPEGSEDMYVDLAGFGEAWSELRSKLTQ